MKKQFEKPMVSVLYAEPATILAASNPNGEKHPIGGTGNFDARQEVQSDINLSI